MFIDGDRSARWAYGLLVTLAVLIAGAAAWRVMSRGAEALRPRVPAGRKEVVFWHFWGGADRAVVERVVERFNASQKRWFVRAVAMPGNNLDLKVFLSVAGKSPPDLINQDDPIIADWAARGAIEPLDRVATPEELARLEQWLFPAATELAQFEGRFFALANGLDVRALFYNRTWLEASGAEPPRALEELDALARDLTERDAAGRVRRFGYVPDPRRLWAWGTVFGGSFYDAATGEVTPDHPRVVEALAWMQRYREQFGGRQIAAFRQGDQTLPGAAFPLFPTDDPIKGRYALIMDGQWRVRDIAAWQADRSQLGLAPVEYGVIPLPPPPGGREHAGWINANFFLLPRGGKNPAGAWEFMKFWTGFDGHERQAAETAVEGGWIPVSEQVVEQPVFQQYLADHPLFAPFVELAASPAQRPIPVIPAASAYDRSLRAAATTTLYNDNAPPPDELLRNVKRQAQAALERARARGRASGRLPSPASRSRHRASATEAHAEATP